MNPANVLGCRLLWGSNIHLDPETSKYSWDYLGSTHDSCSIRTLRFFIPPNTPIRFDRSSLVASEDRELEILLFIPTPSLRWEFRSLRLMWPAINQLDFRIGLLEQIVVLNFLGSPGLPENGNTDVELLPE